MSVPEVAYRVGTQSKRLISRFVRPDFPAATLDDTPLPAIPGFADGVQALAQDPEILNSWRKAASVAQAGTVTLLGVTWPEIDHATKWHIDPVSGQSWPAGYCLGLPYRGASSRGDVKYVVELSRLQYIQPVAALAAVTRDPDLIRFCSGEIECWIDSNPPFDGVHWISGIELALRVVSMLVVTTLLGEAAFTPRQRRKFRAVLAAHGYWLARYPSLFSSANNHLVAEAGGLYLLGTLAPTLPCAARYAAYGRRVLQREALRQIHPDGVGAEQSPTYTAFTLEWLLLCGEVGNRLGQPFGDDFWRRIADAGAFLRWLTDAAGNQPRIGDDDEGRVLYFAGRPDRYASTVLGCIAMATGRPDLAPPEIAPSLCHALIAAPPSNGEFPTGTRSFANGGYTIRRWTHRNAALMLVMDHGPLGYLSIAAHGHADTLALWLHVDGRPVLVDAGTYLYHAGGAWRDQFRGTRAHNTLMVEGRDSSEITGPFNWGRKARARVLSYDDAGGSWHIEAEHDGYEKEFGVRHRRRVEGTSPTTFLITDSLVGNGPTRSVEIGFLVDPALDLTQTGNVWTVAAPDGRPLIRIGPAEPSSGVRLHGFAAADGGWVSPRFGARMRCPRIAFAGRLTPGEFSRLVVEVLPDE